MWVHLLVEWTEVQGLGWTQLPYRKSPGWRAAGRSQGLFRRGLGDLGGWEVCVSPLVWGTDVRGPRTVRVGQGSGQGDMGVSDGGSESRNMVQEATMNPPIFRGVCPVRQYC